MAILPGTRLGPYEVLSAIGSGGMGEVYRARDTKLGRDVALKILPEAFARDAERRARFQREAKVLASLNHSNIAALYGIEDSAASEALVMELVEGPTLAERIKSVPIPVDEVVKIAKQICDALEYAHERGIVHRDLKPANVKLTSDDTVKILDFGLAKALEADAASMDMANSPTITRMATQAAVLLGTAAYMSPEQAKGKPVDRRADIWAFGCLVYEMLAGKIAFGGETITDTLAAIMKEEPEWSHLPAETPVRIRVLLQRCLQKDPKQRLRDIGDARLSLDEILSDGAEPLPVAGAQASSPLRPRSLILSAGALLLVAIISVLATWNLKPAPAAAPKPLTRLNIDLGPDAMTDVNLAVAISPDGRRLVFPVRGPDGHQQLATRLLDQAEPTLLPGTEGGSAPFFSPDGQWIGFFAGGLKQISVRGGEAAQTSINTSVGYGATWGNDGYIIASPGFVGPLFRVPVAGGAAQPFTKLGPDDSEHGWPQVLPGGGAVLFTAAPAAASFGNANIEAMSLKTGQIKIVQRGGFYGRYLPNGYLVYVHQGVLFGVKFDPQRLQEIGAPVPLLEDVAANMTTGEGQFDFSNTGTFIYTAGKSSAQAWEVAWLDSSGKTQPLLATPGTYAEPRLSPDGRKLAFTDDTGDIYVHDLDRGTTTRLTFRGGASVPVWAPDGKHLAYTSGAQGLYWVRSDGSGEAQLLLRSEETVVTWSLSADGGNLAYIRTLGADNDVWMLPLDLTDPDRPKPGKPEPFLLKSGHEVIPRFSPDSHWVAYRSDESGSNEIYVRPFPASGGGKWQISHGGGLYAVWSKNGRELFYETLDNRIMVVDYSVDGAAFVPGKARVWSDKQLFFAGTSNLDLAPDGKRFAVLALPEAGEKGPVHVTMLLNFFDEVKRKIP